MLIVDRGSEDRVGDVRGWVEALVGGQGDGWWARGRGASGMAEVRVE